MSESLAARRATRMAPVLIVGLAAMLLAGPGVGDASAATAEDCLAGTYFDGTACIPAPVGSFVADEGAEEPTPCPVGQYQDATGKDQCKPIPLGSGGTGGLDDGTRSTGIALCAAGSFRGDATTTKCTLVAAGFFVADEGAEEPTPCPAGTFKKEPGTGRCTEIRAGHEATGAAADGSAATGERACAPGTFKRTAGAGVCTPAPRGSFVPTAGATAAALCPRGSYSSDPGAQECTQASVGFHVPDPGSSGQLPCPTVTVRGSSTCTPSAPADTTAGGPTADEPLAPQGDECPPGTWSPTGTSRGGSSCIPASPGTFVAESGATAERPCQPGTYSDRFGATSCTPAPAGTFVAGSGAMDPMPCAGATEPGSSVCPEVLATATVLSAEPSAPRSMWWWVGGLLLVLVAGGAGFLRLQRRAGLLGPDAYVDEGVDSGHLAGLDATIVGEVVPDGRAADWTSTPDVLEWDEAVDGMGEDGPEPPPTPR